MGRPILRFEQPPVPEEEEEVAESTLTRRIVSRSDWEAQVADEFADIRRELARLSAIKRQKGQPVIYLQMPGEVLKAFELSVITKAEARKLLGQRGAGPRQRKATKTSQATLNNLAKARAARAAKSRAKR